MLLQQQNLESRFGANKKNPFKCQSGCRLLSVLRRRLWCCGFLSLFHGSSCCVWFLFRCPSLDVLSSFAIGLVGEGSGLVDLLSRSSWYPVTVNALWLYLPVPQCVIVVLHGLYTYFLALYNWRSEVGYVWLTNKNLKTYAAISDAHLSRVCKRGKLSGSCLSTLNGFGSTQLSIFLCHIGVPTFSSQNN